MTQKTLPQSLLQLLNIADHVLDQGSGYIAALDVTEKSVSRATPHGINFELSLLSPQGTRLLVFRNARGHSIPNGHFAVQRFDYNPPNRKIQRIATLCSYNSADNLLKDFFAAIDRVLFMRKHNISVHDRQGQTAIRQQLLKMAAHEGEIDKPGIWFPTESALHRVLTENASHLLQTIRERQPASITELSRLTDQSYGRVRRTLSILIRYRFVALFCEGNHLQPVDNSVWMQTNVASASTPRHQHLSRDTLQVNRS